MERPFHRYPTASRYLNSDARAEAETLYAACIKVLASQQLGKHWCKSSSEAVIFGCLPQLRVQRIQSNSQCNQTCYAAQARHARLKAFMARRAGMHDKDSPSLAWRAKLFWPLGFQP
eukprot:1005570-Pleurochrysis_carterae.AAC.5